MAQTALVQVRIDKDFKKEMDSLFYDLGVDMPTAIRMFLRQAYKQRGLPFEVNQFIPNAETIAAMEEADRIAGDSTRKRYSNFMEIVDEARKEMADGV